MTQPDTNSRDEDQQVINFQCGCFVKFWAEQNICKSAMACCATHEKPYQTLEQLSSTHVIIIDKKYTPHAIMSVDEQLAQLKEKFPTAAIAGDRDCEQWVSFECPLWGWNKKNASVRFRITSHYPYLCPDGGDAYQLFRCDGKLHLSDGRPGDRTHSREHEGNEYTLFGGELYAWNPIHDTLLTYARVCKVALQQMGSKSHDQHN